MALVVIVNFVRVHSKHSIGVSKYPWKRAFFLRGRGGQAYHFGKKYFELGVDGEGQDTSKHFVGSFGSIRAILPM